MTTRGKARGMEAILVGLIFLPAVWAADSTNTGSLYGHVMFAGGGEPTGHAASVEFYRADGQSYWRDCEGSAFFLGGLTPGRYSVSGHWYDEGWQRHNTRMLVLDVAAGQDVGPLELTLDRVGAAQVTVRNLPGAETHLYITPASNSWPRTVSYAYNWNNTYSLPLAEGSYRLYAENSGMTSTAVIVNVPANESVPVTLDLPAWAGFYGYVLYNGSPLAGAEILADWRPNWAPRTANTDANGYFYLWNMTPGPHTIWVRKPGSSLGMQPTLIRLGSGEYLSTNMNVKTCATISGQLTAPGSVAMSSHALNVLNTLPWLYQNDDRLMTVSPGVAGDYTLSQVPAGPVTIQARLRNGLRTDRSLVLSPGQTLSNVNFAFPPSYEPTVMVLDHTGQPVRNAITFLIHPDPNVINWDEWTGGDGVAWHVDRSEHTNYILRVYVPDEETWETMTLDWRTNVIVDAAHTNFEVRLPPPVDGAGTVISSLPDPEKDVRVMAALEGGYTLSQNVDISGGTGAFAFTNLAPGEYTFCAVELGTPWCLGKPVHASTMTGSAAGIQLTIGSVGAISGVVTDTWGSAISGARVDLIRGDSFWTTNSDPAGAFAFTHLAGGDYVATVTKGYYAATQQIALAEGEQAVLNFVLPRGSTVAGAVYHADGRPVPGAFLDLWPSDESAGPLYAQANADGDFVFTQVLPKNYVFSVRVPRGTLWGNFGNIAVGFEATVTTNLFLPEESAVTGRVVNALGDPVPGVRVELVGCDIETNSGVNGEFFFPDLAGDNYMEYTVRATDTNRNETSADVTVQLPEATVSNVLLTIRSAYPPMVSAAYPWDWNANNEVVVGSEYGYLRITVQSTSGTNLVRALVRVWFDGTPATTGDVDVAEQPDGSFIMTFQTADIDDLLGDHTLDIAVGDALGNAVRFSRAFKGVPKPSVVSFTSDPAMFSPNNDGREDAVTFSITVENAITLSCAVRLADAGWVTLLPQGGGVWAGSASSHTLGVMTSGVYTATLYVYDSSHFEPEWGGYVPVATMDRSVGVDTTPPQLTVLTTGYVSDGSVIAGAYEEDHGMEFIRWRRTADSEWTNATWAGGAWHGNVEMTEGPNSFRVQGGDSVGNWTPELAVDPYLDTSLPAVVVAAPSPLADNKCVPNADIFLSDTGSGIDIGACSVLVDGHPVSTNGLTWNGASWAGKLPKLSDGTHTFRAVARDRAGNSDVFDMSFRTVTKPPQIISRTPSPGSTYQRLVLAVRVVIDDWSCMGLSNAVLKLDGVVLPSNLDTNNGVLTATNTAWLVQDEHQLQLEVWDNLGQHTSSEWTFTAQLEEQFTGVAYHVPSCKMWSQYYYGSPQYVVLSHYPVTGHGPPEWLDASYLWDAPPWNAFPSTFRFDGPEPHGRNIWVYDVGRAAAFYPHTRDWLDAVSDPDQPPTSGIAQRGPHASYGSAAAYYAYVNTNSFPGDNIPVFFRNALETSATTAMIRVTSSGFPGYYAEMTSLPTTRQEGGGWMSDPFMVPKPTDGIVRVAVARHRDFADAGLSVGLGDPVFGIPGPRIEELFPASDATVEGQGMVKIGVRFKDDSIYGTPYDIDPASIGLQFNGQWVRHTYNASNKTVTAQVSPGASGQYSVKISAKNKLKVKTERTWGFDYVFYGYQWQSLTYGNENYRIFVKFSRDLTESEVGNLSWDVLRDGHNPAVVGLNIVKRVSDGAGRFRDYLVFSEALKRELVLAAYRSSFIKNMGSPGNPVEDWEIEWLSRAKEADSGAFLYILGTLTGQDLAALPDQKATMKEALTACMVSKDTPSELPETYEDVKSVLLPVLSGASSVLGQFDKLKEARKLTKYSKTADKTLGKILKLEGTINAVAGAADFCSKTAALTTEVWDEIFTAYWQASLVEGYRDELNWVVPLMGGQDEEVWHAALELLYFNGEDLDRQIEDTIARAVVQQTTSALKTALKESLEGCPYALAVIKGIDLFYFLSSWTDWDDIKASGHHGVYVSQVQKAAFSAYGTLCKELRDNSAPRVDIISSAALAGRISYASAIMIWDDARNLTASVKSYYDKLDIANIVGVGLLDWAGLTSDVDYHGLLDGWQDKIDEVGIKLQQAWAEKGVAAPTSNDDVDFLVSKVSGTPLYGRPSTLQVEVLSPVWVLVTDPDGRRIGTDASGVTTNEIPGATYSGTGGEPVSFSLPQLTNGSYRIETFGVGTGAYHVVLSTINDVGEEYSTYTFQGGALPGAGLAHEAYAEDGELSLIPPPPLAIGDIVVSNDAPDGVTIRWCTTVPALSSLYYGPTTNCGIGPLGSGAATLTNEVPIGSLDTNALYYYRISAIDPLERNATTPVRSFRISDLADQTPPSAPTGVHLWCNSNGLAVLVWDANTETDLAGYRAVDMSTNEMTVVGLGPFQTTCWRNYGMGVATNMKVTVMAQDCSGHTSTLSTVVSPVLWTGGQVGDMDEDGIPDLWEMEHNLNMVVNDVAADYDGDGLSNLQEYQLGCDPQNVDSDGDGLPDGDEANVHHTSPTEKDSDGDGSDDNLELLCGTSPTDQADVLHVCGVDVPMGKMEVTWSAKEGKLYQVMVSDDILHWTQAPDGATSDEKSRQNASGSGVLVYRDATTNLHQKRFYLIELVP